MNEAEFHALAEKRFATARSQAGPRYSPDRHVVVQISETLDAVVRADEWIAPLFDGIREAFGHLSEAKTSCEPTVAATVADVQKHIVALNGSLRKKLARPRRSAPRAALIEREMRSVENEIGDLQLAVSRQAIDERDGELAKRQRDRRDRASTDVDRAMDSWSEVSYRFSGTQLEAACSGRLVLTGEGGTGKTHSLFDYSRSQLDRGAPVLVFLANELADPDVSHTVLERLARAARIPPAYATLVEFLHAWHLATGDQLLVVVDALNEGPDLDWAPLFALAHQSFVSVVGSVRTGFEGLLPAGLSMPVEQHEGFSSVMGDAVRTYFEFWKLALPTAPLIADEYTNPLMLGLYCEVAAGSPDIAGNVAKTTLFERFVKFRTGAISKRLTLPGGRETLWRNVIKPIAQRMAETSARTIDVDSAKAIVERSYPGRGRELLEELRAGGVVNAYAARGETRPSTVGFAFERLSDHLIARSWLQSLDWRDEKPRLPARLLERVVALAENNRGAGMLEALCLLIPERTSGWELPDLLSPETRDMHTLKSTWLRSLAWRDLQRRPRGGYKFIRTTLLIDTFENLVQDSPLLRARTLIQLAGIPDHPLGMAYLGRELSALTMPGRDATWVPLFERALESSGSPLLRVARWLEANSDLADENGSQLLESALLLAWVSSTTNDLLRRQVQEALSSAGRARIGVALHLLDKLVEVDDPTIRAAVLETAVSAASVVRDDRAEADRLWQAVVEFHSADPTRPNAVLLGHVESVADLLGKTLGTIVTQERERAIRLDRGWSNRVPLLTRRRFEKPWERHEGYRFLWDDIMGARAMSFNDFTEKTLPYQIKQILPMRQLRHWRLLGRIDNRRQRALRRPRGRRQDPADVGRLIDELMSGGSREESKRRRREYWDPKNTARRNRRSAIDLTLRLIPFWLGIDTLKPTARYRLDLAVEHWLFMRVVQLGWRPELHLEFDGEHRDPFGSRRGATAGPIYQKYVWIALTELAMLATPERTAPRRNGYDRKLDRREYGLTLRRVDPTFPFPPGGRDAGRWHRPPPYRRFSLPAREREWLREQDVLDPLALVVAVDDSGVRWVRARESISWESRPQVTLRGNKSRRRRRRIWVHFYPVLIPDGDWPAYASWADAIWVDTGSIPDGHGLGDTYFAEFPRGWAYASLSRRDWAGDDWTRVEHGFEAIVGNVEYSSSDIYDGTNDAQYQRAYMPSRFVIDLFDLRLRIADGLRWELPDGRVLFYEPVSADGERLLVNVELLHAMTTGTGYRFSIIVQGERDAWGDHVVIDDQADGRLEIAGHIDLVSDGTVVPVVRTKFRKFPPR
jgi:hypothetical protein